MADALADCPATWAPHRGERHPEVAAFLAAHEALGSQEERPRPHLRFNVAVYRDLVPLPEGVVSSVRCLFRVGDQLVVCQNADGVHHPWPGGGRQGAETIAEAAVREVREETGWLLDPSTIEWLGWLHLENLNELDDRWTYPHPDAFHQVVTARATSRAGDESWTDTEGYELSSQLLSLRDARALIARGSATSTDWAALPFLDALEATWS